jgi:serine phosphatase RsbU (regulator of sigma subunit)
MRNLPKKARLFIAAVWLLGGAAAAGAAVLSAPGAAAPAWELGAFLLLAVLSGAIKVRLMRHAGPEDVASMSLGFALVFASLLRFGPVAAMIVGAVSTLFSCLYPKRQPAYQLAFNLALNALESGAGGLLFLALNGGALHLEPLRSLPAVVAATLAFYLINTGSVAAVIALCTGQKAPALWKETFLWTAPSFFAGAGVSTAALLLLGPHAGLILLSLSPVIYLTYQSYSLYTARAWERQEHIEQLQESHAQLASSLEREHQIAEALQRSFLIATPDGTFPHLCVKTGYKAASDEALIGGDFYDSFALPGGKVALVVGDASGKGMAAAVRIAEVKYALRAYANEHACPGAILARLNGFACELARRDGRPSDAFVVLALAVLDTDTGQIALSSAGTEPPLILGAGGRATVVYPGGMPLGVDPAESYPVTAAHLDPGDTFLMVTDGITEARRGGEILGYEGFVRLAAGALSLGTLPQMEQAILEGAQRFAQGRLQDDACLLLARWEQAPQPREAATGQRAAAPEERLVSPPGAR